MLVSVFKNIRRIALTPIFALKFAKLPSKTIDIKKSEIEEDFEGYYEDILRVAKVSKTGRMKIEPNYLLNLLNKVENEKDYKMLLDAYYNFVGNAALFPQKIVDNMVKKGIELRQTQLLIPLIENHNFLFYYPSPEIITMMISDIVKNESYEMMQKFIKIFNHQRLLRPEVKTFEIMIFESLKTHHFKNGLKILSYLIKNQILVSISAFEDMAECAIHYFRNIKKKSISEKRFAQIQDILDPNQEKSSKAYFRLAWIHLLRKEHGSFSFSLLSLEDYCKKLVEEKKKEVEKDQNFFIFEKNQFLLDYLAFFEKKVLAQDDPRYMLKFDKFFTDFETNFEGTSRISPEVLPIISECRRKLTEKAKEIQEKAPEIYAKQMEKLTAQILKRNKRFKEMEFKRKMKIEEKRSALEEELRMKNNEKPEKKTRKKTMGRKIKTIIKAKTDVEKAAKETPQKPEKGPNVFNRWVEIRKKRIIKKIVEDPYTGEKKLVIRSNSDGNDPEVTGVIYKRR